MARRRNAPLADISTGAVRTPAGPGEIHLIATLFIATLCFDSLDALKAGLASPQGQAAAADLANFTDGGAELYFFDTKEADCPGRLPRLKGKIPREPGRSSRCSLFARCAGVHVDFHAHRHFDNLRSFPGHSSLPRMVLARVSRA